MTLDSPFKKSFVCYATQTALDIIIRQKGIEPNRWMQILLTACDRNPLTDALCGYIFEQYAIELLEEGGKFICQLFHRNKKIKPNDSLLNIPSSKKTVAVRVLSNQKLYHLYVSSVDNKKLHSNQCLDSWSWHISNYDRKES
jgi:hypothetical protein